MSLWPYKNPTSLDITVPFKDKFGGWLREEILSLRIYHANGKCMLEICNALPSPSDPDESRRMIQLIDLSFICSFSSPSQSIFDDAKCFVEDINPETILNTLPLFSEIALTVINAVVSSNHMVSKE